jgi:DNA processing protein
MSTPFSIKMTKINRISPDNNEFLQITIFIAQKPNILYFIGKLPEKRLPTVAIVGSRKPTTYGKEVTYRLAYDLAQQGLIIVSGLALGIDGLAHQAALEAGGITIAVLANGLPSIYPSSHQNLAKKIIDKNGAIISEYKPETEARPYQFLERNRLISGLSDAVVVTEAARRSGSLNTAMHALEQGREVFVVPGNITSPLSAGCNALLKQGAHPVTSAEDILEVIAPQLLKDQTALPLGSTPLENRLIELLQTGIRDGDELQRQAGCSINEFMTTLSIMELNDIIRALGGNQWTLR